MPSRFLTPEKLFSFRDRLEDKATSVVAGSSKGKEKANGGKEIAFHAPDKFRNER